MAINCPSCDNCLLIDLCCVYDHTPLNKTLGENAIKVALTTAQELLFGSYDLLGEKCYVAICEALASNDPLSDEFSEIISKAEKMLSWATYLYWLKLYGSGTNRKEGRKQDRGSDIQQTDKFQLKTDINEVEGIYKSHYRRFKNWLECQELSCDRCEEDCQKCTSCESCASDCGTCNKCTCKGGPYYPYDYQKKKTPQEEVGLGNKFNENDTWAAI